MNIVHQAIKTIQESVFCLEVFNYILIAIGKRKLAKTSCDVVMDN